MMGNAGFFTFSCLHTSRPLMRGIMTSSTTRSGESFSARPRPSTPSEAVITSYPSNSKLSRRPETIAGSSSTIRILVILGPPARSFSATLCGVLILASLLSRNCLGLRRFFLVHRQRDYELASPARHAFHGNIAAMRLHDVPHQRQTQPASLGVVHQRVAYAVKLLENLVLLGARDADAVVHHLQLDRAVLAIKVYAQV